MKQYPELDVMKVVSFYSLIGTIQCTVFTLIVEKNLSAWKLKINMELLLIVLTVRKRKNFLTFSIVLSQIQNYLDLTDYTYCACRQSLGGAVRTRVHIWYMQIKGPFYVPMFKPVGIVFATIFGISFFANSLHYGR